MMQSQLLSLGGGVDAGGLQRINEKQQQQQQPEDSRALQARIIQLEGQVGLEHDIRAGCFHSAPLNPT